VIGILVVGMSTVLPKPASCLAVSGLEEILDRVHLAEEDSEKAITDYVCQSTFIVRKPQKDGSAKTVLIQDKTVYFRPPDQRREIFRSVTKEGQILSPEKLDEYQKKADEEARQRVQEEESPESDRSENKKGALSFSGIAPWSPEERQHYNFTLLPPDTIRGIPAYVVQVRPREEKEGLVNGIAWFHGDLFQVLKLDFQPAKNPRFVKKAHVILDFAEVSPGQWLPKEMKMDVTGGFLFIKKSFQIHQTWRDYRIDAGIPDSLFLPVD
jgi:hypothetical protein